MATNTVRKARILEVVPETASSVIGTGLTTGREVSIPQKARQQGVYIIGATGTGKSALLANLILRDICTSAPVSCVDCKEEKKYGSAPLV